MQKLIDFIAVHRGEKKHKQEYWFSFAHEFTLVLRIIEKSHVRFQLFKRGIPGSLPLVFEPNHQVRLLPSENTCTIVQKPIVQDQANNTVSHVLQIVENQSEPLVVPQRADYAPQEIVSLVPGAAGGSQQMNGGPRR